MTDTVRVSDSLGTSVTAIVTVVAPPVITTGGGGPVTVPAGGQQTLTASGGVGPYVWTISTNGSGGSITPGGVYTAGPNAGTDVIMVTDGSGASASITAMVSGGGGGTGAPAMELGHVLMTFLLVGGLAARRLGRERA